MKIPVHMRIADVARMVKGDGYSKGEYQIVWRWIRAMDAKEGGLLEVLPGHKSPMVITDRMREIWPAAYKRAAAELQNAEDECHHPIHRVQKSGEHKWCSICGAINLARMGWQFPSVSEPKW